MLEIAADDCWVRQGTGRVFTFTEPVSEIAILGRDIRPPDQAVSTFSGKPLVTINEPGSPFFSNISVSYLQYLTRLTQLPTAPATASTPLTQSIALFRTPRVAPIPTTPLLRTSLNPMDSRRVPPIAFRGICADRFCVSMPILVPRTARSALRSLSTAY